MKQSILWMIAIACVGVVGLSACGSGGGDGGALSSTPLSGTATAEVQDPAWILLVEK